MQAFCVLLIQMNVQYKDYIRDLATDKQDLDHQNQVFSKLSTEHQYQTVGQE